MYIGQSEENVRKVFNQARAATPCVIFFDELDSLAPNRGQSGDSGGVMDRVVSQLLAELDGLNKSTDVFVIGATNRPDLLDSALLRPGRFDRLVYVGIPNDHDSRVNILKALTRKMSLGKEINLEQIALDSPLNMTGADFYALCSNAMMNSIRRSIQNVETGESENNISFAVEIEDFRAALKISVPSVSVDELQRFENIKQNFN
ncbi:peroxisome assembly factor 2-like [Centruroides sculpturatus]|uniref:peroxisome assembly factor 2-like n=1 Tax=Centruroides sculpturatus TaxID=218467 RepID=UPI000C6E31A5|nr:peroxisome assembly factor 2-like [Centruroides sculpturatus]